MSKIVLINPPSNCVDDDHLEPQLGLLYIAALLKQHALDVQIYDMTGCSNETQINKKIGHIPPGDIYGFTTYCTNYVYVKTCIRYIRSRRKAIIVLGGPNPTALPDYTLNDSQCDCVVTGEGEDAFLQVVDMVQRGEKIPSIINGIGRINIDSYPMPAWDLVDLQAYTRTLEGERVVSVASSRGCKYRCIHCNSVVMGGGNSVRYRSPQNIADEIAWLQNKGFHKFRFNDDNFTGNPQLALLLQKLQERNIAYRIFARIEDLTKKNCRVLAESGCRHISVGLESLNPDNLKVLGKFTQTNIEKEHLANAHKIGIIVRAYFMVGLPFDTDTTIEKYFHLAGELPFDEFSIYPLIPYPGTRIAREPARFGYQIINNDFTSYVQIGRQKSTTFALRHRNFSEFDVERWRHRSEDILLASNKVIQKESKTAI